MYVQEQNKKGMTFQTPNAFAIPESDCFFPNLVSPPPSGSRLPVAQLGTSGFGRLRRRWCLGA
jgi:hypothetical protein